MRAQRIDRGVVAGKLRLGQGRVDFIVANLMDQHARPLGAAFQLGDQMMFRLPDAWRDRPEAERADRIVAHLGRENDIF